MSDADHRKPPEMCSADLDANARRCRYAARRQDRARAGCLERGGNRLTGNRCETATVESTTVPVRVPVADLPLRLPQQLSGSTRTIRSTDSGQMGAMAEQSRRCRGSVDTRAAAPLALRLLESRYRRG